MTKEDFILKIKSEYENARKTRIEDNKLKRGTNHSISSYAEDIFGKYIADQISDNYEIWIDPQITINGILNASKKKGKTVRPDVCIFNKLENRIELIFDLKMDIGYNRDEFTKFVENRTNELKKIKSQKGKWKNQEFSFHKDLKWNFIVLSEGNISEQKMDNVKQFFNDYMGASFFVLTSREHLNADSDNYKINDDSFSNIDTLIKKTCK